MARQTLLLEDFSKGLDMVSSLNTIDSGFTPSAMNFRIKEQGGIEKVLGYSAFGTVDAAAHELAYFETKDAATKRLITAQSTAWQSTNSAGTASNIRTGLNATTETTFTQYGDKIYGLDPFNIMASWDGTSLVTFTTGVTTGPPLGIILGIWSNRMWVAKATTNKIGMDIVWSDPADFTKWPAVNSVSLGGVGTSDRIVGAVPTADGLMVFTNRTTWLVYDPATGANNIIDAQRGCSSRHSLAVIGNTVYGMNAEGVFAMEGRFPQKIISRAVEPLFAAEAPDVTAAAGTAWFGAYLGSYRRLGSSTNNITLDLFSGNGSIMANQYPAHCWAQGQLAGNDQRLYFIDASDRTKIRRAFDGGSFAGTAISCFYETPWTNFGSEQQLKRLHAIRLVGRGDLYVGVVADYEPLARDTARLSFPSLSGTGVWDSAVWDTAVWNDYVLFDGWARPSALARRMSLRFYESSSTVNLPRPNLGYSSASGHLGGCGLYLAEPAYSVSSRVR